VTTPNQKASRPFLAGWLRALAWPALFGLAYLALAELGHAFSPDAEAPGFATCWPPAGLLLAALLLTRGRDWAVFLAAAAAANLASDVLLQGRAFAVGVGYCLANLAEACLGAWLLRRYVGRKVSLARLPDVFALVGFGAAVSPAVGGALTAAVVHAADGTPFVYAWAMGWIADAVGVLVVAPVVLTWAEPPPDGWQSPRPGRVAEAAALFFGLVLVTESVYRAWLPPPLTIPGLILPFLLWAGFRFEGRGASSALLVAAVLGLWHASHGHGPWANTARGPDDLLLRAQATLAVIAVSLLAFTAAVAERAQAERQKAALIRQLEQALAEIKTLRGLIPVCAWCKNIRDDQGFWQRLEDYLGANTEARTTHAICPACMEKQLAGLVKPPGSPPAGP